MCPILNLLFSRMKTTKSVCARKRDAQITVPENKWTVISGTTTEEEQGQGGEREDN